MIRTHVKFTVDDYKTLPEAGPRYEVIDGEPYRMTPAPSFWHQHFLTRLSLRLGGYLETERRGWIVVSPIDVYLSHHDVVQPDIAFISKARRDRIAPDGIHGAPDLVVEVLSPSTRDRDLAAKRALYARHGVIEYWAADLDAAALHVFRFDEDPEHPVRTLGPGDTLETPLLPGLRIPLAPLFEPPVYGA